MQEHAQRVAVGQPRSWGWLWYGGVGLLAVGLYFVMGPVWGLPAWAPGMALYIGIHLSTVVALLVGIWRWRPERPLAWWLLVANQSVYLSADVVFFTMRDIWGLTAFPSVADALYIAAAVLTVAALLVFVRQRGGGDRTAAIDAATVGVAVALLSWVLLVGPGTEGSLPFLARATSLAYPVLDVAMATLAARLLLGAGRGLPSFYLLTGGLVLLVVNDSVYGWMQLHGRYESGAVVDGGWLIYYLCVGAAALHPSMRALTRSPEQGAPSWSRRRLVVLSAAALVAPVLLGVHTTLGLHTEGLAMAIGSAALFLLVIVRLSGLMRAQHISLRRNEQVRVELAATLAALERAQTDRARLLGSVVAAAERERIRVAAELHDGPIQHLASMAYAIDRADRRLVAHDIAPGREILSRVREQVANEIVGLRRLMADLRPPVLDEGGLGSALRDYATDFGERHDIVCDLEVHCGGQPVADDIETVIYRVSQEALTNVARHSGAHHVLVRLVTHGDFLQLQIHDDGRGFDLTDQTMGPREGHFGLLGMRERVEGAGGTWQVRSVPGAGTTVFARLPRQLAGVADGSQTLLEVAS